MLLGHRDGPPLSLSCSHFRSKLLVVLIAKHTLQLLLCTSISISRKTFHYHSYGKIAGIYQASAINTPDNNMVLITGISLSPTVKTFCIVTFDQVHARCMKGKCTNMKQQGLQHIAAFASSLNQSWS